MSRTRSVPVVTFVVRLTRGVDGRLRGTVERVRTGRKERFTGADGIGGVIEQMLRDGDGPGGAERHRRENS